MLGKQNELQPNQHYSKSQKYHAVRTVSVSIHDMHRHNIKMSLISLCLSTIMSRIFKQRSCCEHPASASLYSAEKVVN